MIRKAAVVIHSHTYSTRWFTVARYKVYRATGRWFLIGPPWWYRLAFRLDPYPALKPSEESEGE
jgi:hypothetical protein